MTPHPKGWVETFESYSLSAGVDTHSGWGLGGVSYVSRNFCKRHLLWSHRPM